MKALYIDTSAALKQLRFEPETGAYLDYIAARRADGVVLTSSMLLDVELARVAVRDGYPSESVDAIAGQFLRRQISPAVVAGTRRIPFHVRSLDAIHLATAAALGDDLVAIVSYDRQMIRAAERMGMAVVAPGAKED